jgi:hypothetical protein
MNKTAGLDIDTMVAVMVDAHERLALAEVARDVAVRRRRSAIINLRDAGWGDRRIAGALGISPSAVWHILRRADTR